MSVPQSTDFLGKHEFLIRRLHSLTGLIPVGAYMVVHLLVNASLVIGPGRFQFFVNQIHSLGRLLPLIEWVFIFLPILFHGLFGLWIIRTGRSNTASYPYLSNWRYSLQRASGMIAIVFIFGHVFHLHGWIHADWWRHGIAEPLGMANFRPYNAASTLAMALSGMVWPVFYVVGIVACVYHLANGLWTMGITWGIWVSPQAQRWASRACSLMGVGLLTVGLAALVSARRVDVDAARTIENQMYDAGVRSGQTTPAPEKRSKPQ
ncbi:MAG: succinate dehydrogenase cytochrome b558 subunit [Pirellulaceae bacterium]|nr:succinate dehydrogenase cytochrome b558 subunit [Pirellulaceae bacterium]